MSIYKKTTLLLFIGYFLITSSTSGQLIKANPEDIKLADKYKELYPEENFASIQSVEKFRFTYDAKEKTVQGILTEEETILCLRELNGSFWKNIRFDEQSHVVRVGATNYKGKKEFVSTEESAIKVNGIFYNDVSELSFYLSFDRIGERKKYNYMHQFYDIKYISFPFFHSSYPIKEKVIEFKVPKWLDIDFVEINFDNFNIKKTEVTDKKGVKTITYTLKDIEPVNNDILASNYQMSLPHIFLAPKSFVHKKETYNLFKGVEDLYGWYSQLVNQVENEPEVFKQKVAELTKSASTDIEKIEAIFYWVQDNIRYLAYENGIMGFMPSTAQEVYNKRHGDCKGMANLTCEMLQLAGFDARLTWVGTRSIPYDYSIPSLAVDNHMITTLYHNGITYFLDATEKGIALGDYAHRIQGQDVLIENGAEYVIDTIPEFSFDHNSIITKLDLKLSDESISGTGTQTYTGEEKTDLFREFSMVSKTEYDKELMNEISSYYKNIEVSNVTPTGMDDRNTPIELAFDISINNQITQLENELYLNTDQHKDFANLEVEEHRVNDLYFGEKVTIQREMTIAIPAAYQVDYLPESVNIDNDEFSMQLDYSYNQSNHQLDYNKTLIIKTGNIDVKNATIWNESVVLLKKFYNDQIILKKN